MTGFHFPPSALSSGHLRLLAFAKYLPDSGWDPLVLSATKLAYEQVDPSGVLAIPDACRVYRAFALDTKRHLGIRGKYPAMLARPDRWISWWPAAVCSGLYLIKRYRPQAIWSTYPIMTSHCVAYTLSRLTGIPWIADFRDPVTSSITHKNTGIAKSQDRWERRVMTHVKHSVFTAPSAMRWYAERYPELERAGRFSVIENGYDEAAFKDLPIRATQSANDRVVLLHSGVLYPGGRNPVPFFTALARLKAEGLVTASNLNVVLRASGSETVYARELQRLALDDIVELAAPVSNRDALIEQAKADALLLFQGARFDRHIPAKVYEYLRVGRPIFALIGEDGDTAGLLRGAGGAALVAMDDVDAIQAQLRKFLQAVRAGAAPRISPDNVVKYSRREGTVALAKLLDQITEG